MKRIVSAVFGLLYFSLSLNASAVAPAQTAPPLALRVDRYELSVRLVPDDAKAEIQAGLQITNPAEQPVNRLSLRVGESVQVSGVQIDGRIWTYAENKDDRTRTIGLSGDLVPPLRPGSTMKVVVTYKFDAQVPSASSAIDWGECFLLPESFWAPMIHTPFLPEYNVDTAPCALTITAPAGFRAIADGQPVTAGAAGEPSGFDIKHRVQPYFIAGDFELWGGQPSDIEIYLHRGYASAQPATLAATQQEVRKIIEFYAELLGAPVSGPIRIVGSSQVHAYGNTGLLMVDERTFSRKVLDEESIIFLASNVARMWIGARQPIHGAGHGMLYDGLPSYLMSLYMENAYGPQARLKTIERFQRGYLSLVSGLAAYDVRLDRQTLLNREYYTSIFNKVPMVLRLMEYQIGREKFVNLLRKLLKDPRPALSLADFETAVISAGSAEAMNPIFLQWVHDVVLPDFAVGKPVKEADGWSINLANYGTGDTEVTLDVTFADGQKSKQKLKIESQGYARAVFKGDAEPVSARVDGDRLFLQANYNNDAYPQTPTDEQLTSMGTLALGKSDFKTAEDKLREALKVDPENREARAGLARTLAQMKRNDEALREAGEALKGAPLSLSTYALANLARGDVALAGGKAAEASDFYRQAVFSLREMPTLLGTRDLLIRAEREASLLPPIEASLQSFISQFDAAMSSGRPATVKELVDPRTLKLFLANVSFVKSWKSDVLRAEKLDDNRVLVDVTTRTTTGEKESSARALYLLRRHGTGWVLDAIPGFLEK